MTLVYLAQAPALTVKSQTIFASSRQSPPILRILEKKGPLYFCLRIPLPQTVASQALPLQVVLRKPCQQTLCINPKTPSSPWIKKAVAAMKSKAMPSTTT